MCRFQRGHPTPLPYPKECKHFYYGLQHKIVVKWIFHEVINMIEFYKSEKNTINIIRYIFCIPSGFIAYYICLGFLYSTSYLQDFMFGDNWVQEYIPFF